MGSCFICVICTSGTAYTSGMCGGSCYSIFSLVSSGPLFFCLFFFIWFIHSDSIYSSDYPLVSCTIVNTEVMWAILLRHMFHAFDKVNSTTIWGLLHAKNTLTSSYFLITFQVNMFSSIWFLDHQPYGISGHTTYLSISINQSKFDF